MLLFTLNLSGSPPVVKIYRCDPWAATAVSPHVGSDAVCPYEAESVAD